MANYVAKRKDEKSGKWERAVSLSLFVGILVCGWSAFGEERQTRRSERAREARNATVPVDDSLQDALRRIPWSALSQKESAKVKAVVSSHSIFRRLPQQTVYCDSEIYQFLVEHPDIVVGLWERLGVTQISLRELGEDRFLMKEAAGTTAVAEIIHRTRSLCIIHAKGQYRGGILAKPIDGEAVLLLHSRFLRDDDNEPYIVCHLDSFVRLDSVGADLVAKLLSNVLGKIADSNFEQSVGFVGNVSDASIHNTNRVKELSSQMKGVRKEVRNDFADIVDRVALSGAKRFYVFPEYEDFPITAERQAESLFTAYSIPLPVIARQAQPLPMETDDEVPTLHEWAYPIPVGFSALDDDPMEAPQSRAIFRKPNIPAAGE